MSQGKSDDGTVLLQRCLPAIGATSRLLLKEIVAVLDARCPDLPHDNVQIVMAELLNNIVEHAYGDRHLGAVTVQVRRQGLSTVLTTQDWGPALPENGLPGGQLPAPEALAEGGYGWFLIRTLARNISYVRHNGCNRLTLTVPD